ncbi:hypothetical protein DICPUDRAFT_157862 [Dictyostelium purpureum]|uniref:Uncharacterized protein n=1 Tax=Dictyostelium purpureum TaxID=5786 RepID=F1A068_DICPU|nr:uncharacterized protein DICPUDRAFT_157862 [Dictyostelium purpureum]EGC30417.1 hypothetical protein DICPUDRAFT_157862 [Dictyostelium purpureum]|eukprot:XP_003293062.1 hypothetical protein DICPUDRAFT_157862 [Dictyostelium purpureum]
MTACPETPKKQFYNNPNSFEDSDFYNIEFNSLLFGPIQNQKYLYDPYFYQLKKLEWEENNLMLNYRNNNNNNNNNNSFTNINKLPPKATKSTKLNYD